MSRKRLTTSCQALVLALVQVQDENEFELKEEAEESFV